MPNPLITCTDISFSLNDRDILCDISFSVSRGEVVALVGPNGVGKTTLLKILAGKIKANEGTVTMNSNTTIAYVPQEISLEDRKRKVYHYITDTEVRNLDALALSHNIMQKRMDELSGGEKSKVNVLKLIGNHCDVYILDEPTNNLDVHALRFLETFIKKNKNISAFIIVSHDRQLLENYADTIVEIDSYSHRSAIYPGPFSTYMSLRKQKIENDWKNYNDYVAKKKQLERSLREKKLWSAQGEKGPKKTDNEKMARGNMKDWSGKVLGKSVKMSEKKLAELDEVEKPRETLSIVCTIPMGERSGNIVFELTNIVKNKIGPINLTIQFGNRLVIMGDNGVGKTTLLRMLVGEIPSDSGEIRRGSRVIIGYLPQEPVLGDRTIIDQVKELSTADEREFRKFLDDFGITKDEMRKNGSVLSPGERSRFELASIMMQKPNCLIFDEPTNHLDIYALDFLENAIQSYQGTIIIVTHDRYFLNRMSNYKVYQM